MPDGYLAERFSPGLREMVGSLYDLFVYIDGRFVKGEEAKVSVYDHGFLYADGVFEGIRAYGGRVFKLEEHVRRLFESARTAAIACPLGEEEVCEAVVRTCRVNSLRDAHIRPLLTRGCGPPGMDHRRAVRSSLLIMAYPFPPLLGVRAASLFTSALRRSPADVLDGKVKCLNYFTSTLAKFQAIAAGGDDALMLDTQGLVAEASGENVFLYRRGRLRTPLCTAALEGVTRGVVLEEAGKLGVPAEEGLVTLHEVYAADEVFLTGSGAEIVPVGKVDGRPIGTGEPGPLTLKLIEAYRERVRREGRPIFGG